MPFTHHFKPTHKEIKTYYEELAAYAAHEVSHETAVRSAFQNLLAATCKKADWHLVPEQTTRVRGKQVRPDGILRDDFNLHRGYWEAKDFADKLDAEICKMIALGYPLSNMIFEDKLTAVLYQNDQPIGPQISWRLFRLYSCRASPIPFNPIAHNRAGLVEVRTKRHNKESAIVEHIVNSHRSRIGAM